MSSPDGGAAALFEDIVAGLIRALEPDLSLADLSGEKTLEANFADEADIAWQLNSAFLISLCGKRHSAYPSAIRFLDRLAENPDWGQKAAFYRQGSARVGREITAVSAQSNGFRLRLETLAAWFSEQNESKAGWELAERTWQLFHPEAAGICGHETARTTELLQARTVRVTQPNPEPIINPAREIVFTGNVLLTPPPASKPIDDLELAPKVKRVLQRAASQEQQFWYDHPIQIGVEPEANEVLYGLRGLAQAYRYELQRSGVVEAPGKLTVLLSVSTTHPGLHAIAKDYLESELRRAGDLDDLEVYVFTETDSHRLAREVLAPAMHTFLGDSRAETALEVFGVDGEYGRHYSFLKAIAAFWHVFVRPEVKATFKIDLDQVFPQEKLVEQTNRTAFDHFRTPLWGGRGLQTDGSPVELGMIAGALVNQEDIEDSLFTPDVPFPEAGARLTPEEHIFFSRLPQALSTQAEMMTRYSSTTLDGKLTCLQRVHVTGGTNGILVESLRRHRPFTPTFIGRAEDQAYILSVFAEAGARLAYLHAAGLIMRHDKEEFAQEAIHAARTGRQIGDLVRTLYFSAYAHALELDFDYLKSQLAPFTGSFVSEIPITVVYLRFAMQVASLYANGSPGAGLELVREGARRLSQALAFTRGDPSPLKTQYRSERDAWGLYYSSLAAVERGLHDDEPYALELRSKARSIIQDCRVASTT